MSSRSNGFETSPVRNLGSENLSLSQGLEAFLLALRVVGRSPQTLDLYQRSIEPLIKFLGDRTLEEVTSGDLRQFIAHLQTRMRSTTVGIRWRSIRAFFNWLYEEGWLKESITERIQAPKTPKIFPNALSQSEIEVLIKAAHRHKNGWHGQRNYTMMLTFLDTGIRRAELRGITLDNIDFKRNAFQVIGKGSREREVYFGRRLARVLHEWLHRRTHRLFGSVLFCTRQGYELNLADISRIISRLAKEAGIRQKVSCHTLRHSFATHFIRNGGDPFSLQRLLGHADIQTAMIYVHMAGTALREAHAKASPVDKLLG